MFADSGAGQLLAGTAQMAADSAIAQAAESFDDIDDEADKDKDI